MELSYLAAIVGVPITIGVLLTFMKRLKIASMMREKKAWLIELADSWRECDVVEYDPCDVVTEEVFQDMIGDS
jgi:hypothetical protein